MSRTPGTYISPADTAFYYLHSRYYDAATCRFINADSYSSTGQGILGYNMFAYCNNSPVIQADQNGECGLTLLSVAVGAFVNVATSYIAAKVTGQEFTLFDLFAAAAAGALNAIPRCGPYIAGAISGIYSAGMALYNGATLGEAALCFVVSAAATGASISNLANFKKPVLDLATTAAVDLVFGTGYNCMAAATYNAVTTNAQNRTSSYSKPSEPGVTRSWSGNAGSAARNRYCAKYLYMDY